MTRRWAVNAALFSVKCFIGAMLAYWIALRIGLTRPYWAVATSYIVAQPLAGAAVSKAIFRLIGTALGATAAVLLVPNLVNAPELLSLGLGLWLGLCLYISLQDRTPRSYIFLLAGYTASIIGFPSVEAPGAVFTTALLRVQEISLGILCGSLVQAVILPQSVTSQLLTRIEAILGDVERWTRDALGEARDEMLDRDRRRLALDINELHQLSIHLPFDTARFLPRVRTVRAFQDQLSLILPLASAAEDRIAQLRAIDALPPPAEALIARVRDWLAMPPQDVAARAALTDELLADARALEPTAAAPLAWSDALLLSLAARLADLIAAHHAVRDLREQMRSPSRRAVSPVVAAALAQTSRRAFHRDRPAALRAALGTTMTILLGCAFWIGSGWADGAGAVLISGVACALFGASDDPRPMILSFLWGTIIGVTLAAIYAFAIMPRVTDFVTLVVVLAPVLLVIGSLLTLPRAALITTGTVMGFINIVGLNDHYSADFAAFLNGALAQIVGTAFAAVTVGLFQVVGADRSVARIIRAGWREIARRSNLPGRSDVTAWVSKMLDRIGLLAPRLAAMGDDPGRPMLDALQDLRVGVTVGQLRDLRVDAGAPAEELITPVLRGVGRYYAARRLDRPPPDDAALLEGIDQAMQAFSHDEDIDVRRRAVLALTGLRRNLFPMAAPYGVPVTA
ncbi:MAG: FUSC family protein [Candidatus Sphingomonas colombiensis]|nr:FUSC family protein [Sphingomonas sp.]WEK44793.1 MAG: FUSC family protein [Sphingomonas sp.]